MRKFSNAVKILIASDELTMFYLVSIVSDLTTIRHTNLPFDVTVPGLGTYSADNDLIGTEPPKQSAVVDREVYKITYSDSTFIWRDIFEVGLAGALATVHMGFINTTDMNLGGVAPGHPLLNEEDLIIAYRGFIDTQGHTVKDGEVTAVVECSSPMADLGLIRANNASRDALRQKDATDTAFDFVYAGSKSIDLLWGKK